MTHPDIANDISIHSGNDGLASRVLGLPDDVLDDAGLTLDEKRAVLASWASDANAVPHLPALRQLPDGSIVPIGDILRALKALDAPDDGMPASWRLTLPWARSFRRLRRGASRRDGYRNDADDDDDPPPCPAIAAGRPRRGGGGALVPPEALAA